MIPLLIFPGTRPSWLAVGRWVREAGGGWCWVGPPGAGTTHCHALLHAPYRSATPRTASPPRPSLQFQRSLGHPTSAGPAWDRQVPWGRSATPRATPRASLPRPLLPSHAPCFPATPRAFLPLPLLPRHASAASQPPPCTISTHSGTSSQFVNNSVRLTPNHPLGLDGSARYSAPPHLSPHPSVCCHALQYFSTPITTPPRP